MFLEAIFCLLGGVFQNGSWNGYNLVPNGPKKGVAAAVFLSRGCCNGSTSAPNGLEKRVAVPVFCCMVLEKGYRCA